jgi:hypothetical protein
MAILSVEVVRAHHDLLDYLAACGGLAGGLAGIAALIFAGRSARDASRSAHAAEESLAIMKDEAQAAKKARERRADLSLEVLALARGISSAGPPEAIILELKFINDGSRAAERLLVNFFVPDLLSLEARNADGEPEDVGQIIHTSATIGRHRGQLHWDYDIGPVEPAMPRLQHLWIISPPSGDYTLLGALANEDLPDGQRSYAWRLTVPETGDKICLVEVDPNPLIYRSE